MKRDHPILAILISILCAFPFSGRAQWTVENSLNVRHAVFLHPESGPYVETYLNLHGRSLRYEKLTSGRFQASASVTILLRDGERVVDFLKYKLESPIISDTANIDFALTDLQRLPVPQPGLELEVLVADVLQEDNSGDYRRTLTADFSVMPAFSDIELLDEYKTSRNPGIFTKNGMDMIPYAINFYPTERNKLLFYAELYGTDEVLSGEGFLLTYSIRERGSDQINPNFWQYQKTTASSVIPVLREFDLNDLPTGNYDVVTEIRNRQNEVLLSKRTFFQRLNNRAVDKLENIAMLDVGNTWAERYSSEQLQAYLEFIQPVAQRHEQNLIISLQGNGDSTLQQRFLFNFWLQRDTVNPYAAWLSYLETVKDANILYGTTSTPGYRTDRGRVLLQYGEPNDITRRVNEPSAKPYEIWQYYSLADGQTNIRFIFYEPTMVTNNYKLIHSNAVGELQDPRWKMLVYGAGTNPSLLNNFDAQNPQSTFGGNAGQLEDDAGDSIFNEGKP